MINLPGSKHRFKFTNGATLFSLALYPFFRFFFTTTVESQLLFAERACVFIVDVGTQLELRATTLKVEKTSLNGIFLDLFQFGCSSE